VATVAACARHDHVISKGGRMASVAVLGSGVVGTVLSDGF
jgi:hypothetical protein